MKGRVYPEYRSSGVQRLGDIPAHWEARRLKYCVRRTTDAVAGPEFDLPYVGLEQVASWTGRLCFSEQAQSITGLANVFQPGDVLFGKLRPYLAKVVRAESPGMCTGELLVLRPDGAAQGYLFYSLLSPEFIAVVDASTYGAKMPRASWEFIGNLPILVPPSAEQRAIAAFLDRETARIDALIARKERQIELLEEKRAALISHAVTKGLDPNVPMKDTGIEWLGEMPAHWEVVPLKHITVPGRDAVRTGPFGSQLLASEMVGGTIKVYNQRSVLDKNFCRGENYVSREKYAELSAFGVSPGDLLVTTRGTIGRCAIVPEEAELGILHPCLMRVRPEPAKMRAEYLATLIQDSVLVRTQLLLMSNATTIDVIYSDSLKRVQMPLPPRREQDLILAHLDQVDEKAGMLSKQVGDSIGILREFRTALISAAVTGKIDVRGEV